MAMLAARSKALLASMSVTRVQQIGRTLAGPAGLATILALVFVAYLGTIDDWFVSDDFSYLRASQTASFPGYVVNAFDFTTPYPDPVLGVLYRPLYVVSFLGFYRLFGLDAWPYHLLGIVVHMANAGLVWLIGYRLSKRLAVAHVAALSFGLHPAYAPAVAWITNNVAIFATFFALSSLLLFLKYLDGGATRSRYYGASFLALLTALLLHPESATILAILVLSYLLLHVRSLRELLYVRTWLPIYPHIWLSVIFLGLHLWVRQDNQFQFISFTIGPHIYENYLQYMALAGNPFGVDIVIRPGTFFPTIQLEGWRTFVPIIGVSLTSLYLLVIKRSRPKLLVLLWFYVALLPLSTWLAGAQPRKLYAAGPGLALMIAMAGVSIWDWAAAAELRLPLSRWLGRWCADRQTDVRRAAQYQVPVLAMLLVFALVFFAVALPLRISQVTDSSNMARVTLTSISGETYQEMLNQIRETYPTLPEGSRLDLVGPPVPMLIFFGGLDLRMVNAVQLYYGDINVVGARTMEELLRLPPPADGVRRIVQFECPPLCPGQ